MHNTNQNIRWFASFPMWEWGVVATGIVVQLRYAQKTTQYLRTRDGDVVAAANVKDCVRCLRPYIGTMDGEELQKLCKLILRITGLGNVLSPASIDVYYSPEFTFRPPRVDRNTLSFRSDCVEDLQAGYPRWLVKIDIEIEKELFRCAPLVCMPSQNGVLEDRPLTSFDGEWVELKELDDFFWGPAGPEGELAQWY